MSAGEAMFSGLAEVSQEMMSFANVRLRAEMECAEDFAKANSPEDLFEKQCSFARQAARQYAEETSKLIGMFARIQQSCWAPMEACTKAALHGIDGAVDGEEKKYRYESAGRGTAYSALAARPAPEPSSMTSPLLPSQA